MTDLDHAKAALRIELRARRLRLKAEAPDAAVQAALAFAQAGLGPFATAAIYHPRGGELDPFPLAAILERQGCRIALPVAVEAGRPLVFRLIAEGGPLPVDAAGVPAPGPDAVEVAPDLVIVPLLAFDRAGRRLGQADGLPVGPFDRRLDGVLTERGFRPAEAT